MSQLELLAPPPSFVPDIMPGAFETATKTMSAYKTISEVADDIGVPQHVLRFWESHFPQVKPTRMRGGRRYYRPEDIDLLRKIKTLLYAQGYTIKGAKKLVRNKSFLAGTMSAYSAASVKPAPAPAAVKTARKAAREDIQSLVSELRTLKAMLATLQ